jgi:ssRNA-specific RNase YbeY (16S rRNA maturation enzyme)
MLHLAGHEDEDPTERATMESAQEAIVSEIWDTTLKDRLT